VLDLSKPLGPIEGLALFADHEQPALVYYLPDEVDLGLLAEGRPDLALQIFYPGVRCGLSPEREARVRGALASRLGRDDLRLTPPPWEDGAVELLLLDTQSGDTLTGAVRDDRLVRGVVGSRRPSLHDGTLAALFHARLDQRGTALAAAAVQGAVGSVAGVLYDLEFAALRPTVDLRMRAELNRCAEFIRTALGVQVYYVADEVSAAFGQMKEQGLIEVDLVSQVADPESERLVNEAAKDFYDVLMRELFRPTVSPAEALGAAAGLAGAGVQTSIVKLSFAYTRVEHERTVEVDYRKRAAARRTHNPQAHLRRLAALGGGAEALIQRVPLSLAWREMAAEIAAPDAFRDAALRQVRVVLWRGRDPVLAAEGARDGGLRMPETAVPLADFAFAQGDAAPRRLAWVNQPDEPAFYRWQARLTYVPEEGVESPREIWTEPHVSSSRDLDLFPETLAPRHELRLAMEATPDGGLAGVDADVVLRQVDGRELAQTRLSVDRARPEARWALRTGEQVPKVLREGRLTYRYGAGRTLALPPRALLDREVPARDPFSRVVGLTPLVVGAPDGLLEVDLLTRYVDEATGYRHEAVTRLRPPDFRAEEVRVPVLRNGDAVAWEAVAVRANGESRQVGRGVSQGGVVTIAPQGVTRRIRVEWVGRAPADLGIRWARVTLRTRVDDGQVGESRTVEFRGPAPPEQEVVLPAAGRVEWAMERRLDDGQREQTPFRPVEDDLLAVSG
jgi:hypothetical protein